MEQLDDKAFVMVLLREATEQSLKLEALSLITATCTSPEHVDWAEIRGQLEILLDKPSSAVSLTHANNSRSGFSL